jgi:hypothetical protein
MILAFQDHELNVLVGPAHGVEHILALLDGHNGVTVAVDEQHRRADRIDVLDRETPLRTESCV